MNFKSLMSVKALASLVSALSILVGAVFAVDSRYAKAADIKQLDRNTQLTIEKARQDDLEDKLFVLQQKPPTQRTGTDRALIDRYERRLNESQVRARILESK